MDGDGTFAIEISLFIGSIIVGALIGGCSAAYSSIKKGDEWYEVLLKTLGGAALGGMLGAATGTGAALAAGGTIAGLSSGFSVAIGMSAIVGGSAALGAANGFINQIIDNDWNYNKINWKRIRTDALVSGAKGLLSFAAGAWTGSAGLWNIPKGSAPGTLNWVAKVTINTIISNGWKIPIDIVYSYLLGEKIGWIEFLKNHLSMN